MRSINWHEFSEMINIATEYELNRMEGFVQTRRDELKLDRELDERIKSMVDWI